MASEICFLRRSRDRADEVLEAEERLGAFAEAVVDDLKRRRPPLPCLMSFTSRQSVRWPCQPAGSFRFHRTEISAS